MFASNFNTSFQHSFPNQQQQQQQQQLFNNSIDSNSSVTSNSFLTAANTIVFNSASASSSSPSSYLQQPHQHQTNLISPLATGNKNSLPKLNNLQLNSPAKQAKSSSFSNALFQIQQQQQQRQQSNSDLDFDLHYVNTNISPNKQVDKTAGIPFIPNSNNAKLKSSKSDLGQVIFKEDDDDDDLFGDDEDNSGFDDNEDTQEDTSNENSMISMPPTRMTFAHDLKGVAKQSLFGSVSNGMPIEQNKLTDANNNSLKNNLNSNSNANGTNNTNANPANNSNNNNNSSNRKFNFFYQNSVNNNESISPTGSHLIG